MKIDTTTGLLDCASYIASPNQDQRSGEQSTDLIVLHNISLPPAQFEANWVADFFTNSLPPDQHPYFESISQLKVSSHLYIRRSGEIFQFVPFHQRAWHAGVSCYQEKTGCNDFSIGIELEGTDDIAYEVIQYTVLAEVLEALIQAYPDLKKQRITGHSDIAPGRKSDPGNSFDWQKLRQLLNISEFEKA
ncbi:MAG: 1,6-anhydro-N-acetylmuramyl-L-alanine amidase AmpD [Gammaproteobacteria bacterium]|nr:1,6-anhydro-N-acetylmuramyl-L-alanine amidase AmpD [Gammaproteobacteria bacterium]